MWQPWSIRILCDSFGASEYYVAALEHQNIMWQCLRASEYHVTYALEHLNIM